MLRQRSSAAIFRTVALSPACVLKSSGKPCKAGLGPELPLPSQTLTTYVQLAHSHAVAGIRTSEGRTQRIF